MSLQSTAHKFVELCRQGKNFDVMHTTYAPDIVSVEGDGKQTKGQQPVIKKSEDWVSDKTFHGETVGATSVGGVPLFREVFGPLLFDVVHVPSPAEEGGWERAFAAVERTLREEGDTVAGEVPVMGVAWCPWIFTVEPTVKVPVG